MNAHNSAAGVEKPNKLPEDDRQFRPKHVDAIIKNIVQQVCFKYYVNIMETVSGFYFLLSFFLSVLPGCLLEVNIHRSENTQK
jgi:hypothetical protein